LEFVKVKNYMTNEAIFKKKTQNETLTAHLKNTTTDIKKSSQKLR